MPEKNKRRSEDRRVKRTKKLLRECLFSLLETKNIDEITVKELTEAADVNRSTFYFYYRDINDMMKQIQAEIFAVFEDEVVSNEAVFTSVDDLAGYILSFLKFCQEHARICKFVIGNDPNNNLTNMIRKSLAEHLPDTNAVFPADDPRRYLTTYAVNSVWQTVIIWLYDGMTVDAEVMANFLAKSYFFGGRAFLNGEVK